MSCWVEYGCYAYRLVIDVVTAERASGLSKKREQSTYLHKKLNISYSMGLLFRIKPNDIKPSGVKLKNYSIPSHGGGLFIMLQNKSDVII